MEFAFTEEQKLIQETAEAFLAERCDSLGLRRIIEGEDDGQALQDELVEMGWSALAVPEDAGGLGLGLVEQVLVLEQMGRRLLPGPFFSSAVYATHVLSHACNAQSAALHLEAIAGGQTYAVALQRNGVGWGHGDIGGRAQSQDDGYCLCGTYNHVLDAQNANVLIVAVALEDGGEPAVFAVPTDLDGVNVTPLNSLDHTRDQACVSFKQLKLDNAARLDVGVSLTLGLQRAAALSAIAFAAECVGAAQQCLDLSVEYTQERKQFGRAVGSFQAVKHRLAEMMVKIEASRSAVYGAAAGVSDTAALDDVVNDAAMAKALASETLFFCAQEAIQLHGGVGFTWEYDPQLYFKRAQAAAVWFGTAADHRRVVADALLGA